MSIISASVGRRGTNRQPDVRVVQFLLNRAMEQTHPLTAGLQPGGSPFGTLVITAIPAHGRADDATIRAIVDFQRQVVRLPSPDGRVDPHGKTIRHLIRIFTAEGGVVPLTVQQAMPLIRPASRIMRAGATLSPGGIIQAGETVAGLDGRRLILSIDDQDTIFLLLDHSGPGDDFRELNPIRGRLGAMYRQHTEAFLAERDTMFLRDLGRRLEEGVQQLQDFEINMTLGAISAVNGFVSAALTARQVVEFVVNNRQWLIACVTFLRVYLRVRPLLMQHAPELVEHIERALLHAIPRAVLVAAGAFGDDVFGNLDRASTRPESLGKLVGVMAAILGQALAGRFGAIRAVLSVITAVLWRVAASIPAAIAITAADKLNSAREIVRHFQNIGVPTTLEQAQRIIEEILAHPAEIRGALEDLAQAAAAIRATAD